MIASSTAMPQHETAQQPPNTPSVQVGGVTPATASHMSNANTGITPHETPQSITGGPALSDDELAALTTFAADAMDEIQASSQTVQDQRAAVITENGLGLTWLRLPV